MASPSSEYIVAHFEQAVEENRVVGFVQPVVRALTSELCGLEILARWDDPEYGSISPAVFVPALEEAGLIHKLDLHMTMYACFVVRYRRDRDLPIVPVSVNYSRFDFELCDLPAEIDKLLKEFNVSSRYLVIEVTESRLFDNPVVFGRILNDLQSRGHEVWMDDFGSGYSSLNTLKAYPFDTLKIDMRFFDQVSPRALSIIASIVDMAKRLRIHTLAEGVETEDQVEFLRSVGCEMIQGYYYGKPMHALEIDEFLVTHSLYHETPDDRAYWDEIGRVNFLSNNPLSVCQQAEQEDPYQLVAAQQRSTIPLALVECQDDYMAFVSANPAFHDEIAQLGCTTLEDCEESINDPNRSVRSRLLSFAEDTAVDDGKVRSIDFVFHGALCEIHARRVANTDSKSALLLVFRVHANATPAEMFEEYGRSLYSTYSLVNILHPGIDRADRVYTALGLEKVYGTSSLREGVADFTKAAIHPDDRERYRAFFDLDTLDQRVDEIQEHFVEEPFRVKRLDGSYQWCSINITHVDGSDDRTYVYSIRRASALEAKIYTEHFE